MKVKLINLNIIVYFLFLFQICKDVDFCTDAPKKRKADDEEEPNKTKKPKKEKKVFQYGNYDQYYGYRSKSKSTYISNPTL